MPARKTSAASKTAKSTNRGTPPGKPPESAQTLPDSTVTMPASLTGRAAAIWAEYAPVLILQGMLTARDVVMFCLWCRLAEKVETGELSGALVSQFRLIANDFGLTPSGKGRELGPIPPPSPSAPKSKFFHD
jgi:phage terminase small subunit